MNIFSFLYNEALFRPLLNLLIGITNVLPGHSVGWAIIFVTIIVRLILLPSFLHQAKAMQKNQEKMKKIQSQLDDAKKKHKEETMRIYREAGVNPASGCLPLIVQLPVLLALYRVFFTGLTPDTYHFLYSFVAHPVALSFTFLGINLSTPSLLLGVIAGIFQFIQMKYLSPAPQAQPGGNEETAAMMASMQKNMMYIFPAMTVFISFRLPAALALYWSVSTLFGIVQQLVVKKTLKLKENPPGI